jgi:hypothetical protein
MKGPDSIAGVDPGFEAAGGSRNGREELKLGEGVGNWGRLLEELASA